MADDGRRIVEGVLQGVGVGDPQTLQDRVEATELWFVLHRPTGRAWGRRGQFEPPIELGEGAATATGAFDIADFARSREEAEAIAKRYWEARKLPRDHNIVSIRVRVQGMTIINEKEV
jgi:hypothetical protein